MYIYIFKYTCKYMYVYVYVYGIHICKCICICICMCMYVYIYNMYVYVYVYIYIYVCICICICICQYVYVYVYIYIYIIQYGGIRMGYTIYPHSQQPAWCHRKVWRIYIISSLSFYYQCLCDDMELDWNGDKEAEKKDENDENHVLIKNVTREYIYNI